MPEITKVTENSYPLGCLFDLEMMMVRDSKNRQVFSDWQWIARILIIENSQNVLKMGFSVSNLPLGEYYFRMIPKPRLQGDTTDRPIYRLGVNTDEYEQHTDRIIYDPESGKDKNVRIKGCWLANNLKSGDMPSVADVEDFTGDELFEELENFDDTDFWYARALPAYVDPETESWSTQSSPPIKISSVSEIVDVEFPITNYIGHSVVAYKLEASERMQSIPSLIMDIKRGRKLKKIKYGGVVNGVSGFNIINGVGYNQVQLTDGVTNILIQNGDLVIDLRTGLSGVITNISASQIWLDRAIGLQEGDNFFVYTEDSSSYFPDIYVDLLTADNGGLGGLFKGYDHLDAASIFKAKQFVFRKGYYWDGVINNQIPFSRWASTEARASRLLPTRVAGLYGLIPEDELDVPIAVFNETNIIKNSYEEVIRPSRETELDRVVINYKDGYNVLKPQETMTIEYSEDGTKPNYTLYQEKVLELPSVTRPRQALEIGASILMSARLQKRIISFRTSIQGFYVNVGDLIIVQHRVAEIESEMSGRVLGIVSAGPGNRVLAVQNDVPAGIPPSQYFFSYYSNGTDTVFQDMGFWTEGLSQKQIAVSGNMMGQGLAELGPGDPYVVSKESSVDTVYRVTGISDNESYEFTIDAIEWDNNIFNLDTIYSEPTKEEILGTLDVPPDRTTTDFYRVKKEEYYPETSNADDRIRQSQDSKGFIP